MLWRQGNIEGVVITTGSRMNMTVNGNVTGTAVFSTRTCVRGTHDMCIGGGGFNQIGGTGSSADGFGRLNVSGNLEVTNGGGGAIVYHSSDGGGKFVFRSGVMLVASFGGSSLTLVCAHAAGRSSACKELASLQLPPPTAGEGQQLDQMVPAEKLSWECGGSSLAVCHIRAEGGPPSTLFVVRKTA